MHLRDGDVQPECIKDLSEDEKKDLSIFEVSFEYHGDLKRAQ